MAWKINSLGPVLEKSNYHLVLVKTTPKRICSRFKTKQNSNKVIYLFNFALKIQNKLNLNVELYKGYR